MEDQEVEMVVLVHLGALVRMTRVFQSQLMKAEFAPEEFHLVYARILDIQPQNSVLVLQQLADSAQIHLLGRVATISMK